MQRTLLFRLLAIAGLMVILLLCLNAVSGIGYERQARSAEVRHDIARSSAYAQAVAGPVLVVPYRRTVRSVQWVNGANDESGKRTVTREIEGSLHLLPDSLIVDGTLANELRRRGIFRAHLYRAELSLAGEFVVPVHFGVTHDLKDFTFGQPRLAIGVSDIRGIEGAPRLIVDEVAYPLEPGASSKILREGVHARVPIKDDAVERRYRFALSLTLQGTDQLLFTPVGRSTQVQLSSSWPHPSFVGEFLPVDRAISDAGFNAQWSTSFFATNLESLVQQCNIEGDNLDLCSGLHRRDFGVSLVDPVDHYTQSERAIKYGLLFIVLTFAGFFLFEVLKRIAVHPIQYAFVGMALVVFYLLLLSLSEHVGFAAAYGASTIGCLALIVAYLRSVLRSWTHALGFGAGLATVYGVLYTVLSAEDYALLLGSGLIFGALGLAMYLTRQVDWFGIDAARGRADVG